MNTPVLNLLTRARPLTIAHRGLSVLAPENTLPSFQSAIDHGADMVELDYHTSRDGVAMAVHDSKLDRTTDAVRRWRTRHIRVASKTADELRRLDAGSWFAPRFAGTGIPLLSEALDLIQKCSAALIERKSGEAADCLALLRKAGLINRVVVQSFDWQFLRQLHEQEPAQVLGALGPPERLANGGKPGRTCRQITPLCLDELKKTGAKVAVWNRHVAPLAIKRAHDRGLKVWVYTIDKPAVARRLVGAGVDGIITNNTPLIKKALETGNK